MLYVELAQDFLNLEGLMALSYLWVQLELVKLN